MTETAISHPLDIGLLKITVKDESPQIRLEINPQIGADLLKVKLSDLTPLMLAERKRDFLKATLQEDLVIQSTACVWNEDFIVTLDSPQMLSLEIGATCESGRGDVDLKLPFLSKMMSSYHLIAVLRMGDAEQMGGADPANSTLHFDYLKPKYGIADFIMMGLEHIGIAKSEWVTESRFHWPEGIDHLLFVVALVLGGGTIWAVLGTVTGFTIGHTISLALVSFGLVSLHGRWIEATIAGTIALVAGQTVFYKREKPPKHRFLTTVAIGLIHGLGFATALTSLNLASNEMLGAVFGFNLGVEIGQAAVIFAIMPLLFIFRRSSVFNHIFIRGAAFVIMATSLYWFSDRL